ncbi:MAG: site-specific integrase [Armatimonadetes bacterium]|nr:site-specific integrase [Armatimonadota bacterium]
MYLQDLIAQFRDYLLAERAASPATVSAYMATLSRLVEFLSQRRHLPRQQPDPQA